MKHLLILLLCLTQFSYAQSEREQKLSKIGKSNITSNRSQLTESSQKIVERDRYSNQSRQTFESHGTPFNSHLYRNSGYYNWLMWGAPYSGFVDFYPSFYYDRFGFRQPARVYQMADGTTKKVEGKKTHYRLGIGYGYKNDFSFWGSIGKKTFFIAEYSDIITNDRSSFMPYVTMDEVILWGDKQLETIKSGGTIYAGGGTKISKFGFYLMGGYSWETQNLQFFDELYILSNNGRYSIRDYKRNFLTGKLGLIYDYKYLSIKTDYDIFRNVINLGCGIIF